MDGVDLQLPVHEDVHEVELGKLFDLERGHRIVDAKNANDLFLSHFVVYGLLIQIYGFQRLNNQSL